MPRPGDMEVNEDEVRTKSKYIIVLTPGFLPPPYPWFYYYARGITNHTEISFKKNVQSYVCIWLTKEVFTFALIKVSKIAPPPFS